MKVSIAVGRRYELSLTTRYFYTDSLKVVRTLVCCIYEYAVRNFVYILVLLVVPLYGHVRYADGFL